MLSRAKPSPPVPNHGPGAERHLAVLEERRRRVVAEPELAAVEPGEEAGLGHRVADGGQLALEQRREAAAVQVEVAEQRVEPRAALDERRDGGEHAEVARVVLHAGGSLPRERGALLGARDDDRRLEAGDVPGLARAREREPVGGRLVAERRGTGTCVAPSSASGAWISSESTITPCRVGELGDRGQLLARVDAAGRVVRVAEQVGGGAVGERALERVEVELPDAVVAERERRLDDAAPGARRPSRRTGRRPAG